MQVGHLIVGRAKEGGAQGGSGVGMQVGHLTVGRVCDTQLLARKPDKGGLMLELCQNTVKRSTDLQDE